MKGKLISLSVQYRCLHVSLVYRWSSLVLNQVLIFLNVVLNPFMFVSSWLSNSFSRLAQHNYHVLDRSSAYSNLSFTLIHQINILSSPFDCDIRVAELTAWPKRHDCMKPLDFLFTFVQIRSLPARLLVNDADYNQIPSSVVVVVVVVLHHEWTFSLLRLWWWCIVTVVVVNFG